MPDETFKMFDAVSNFELRLLARTLIQKLPDNISTEIYRQERNGHESQGSQFRFLNRLDLLNIIYGYLMPEIKRIDETPLDDLPTLINVEWSCSKLTARVNWRLAHAK